MEFFGIIKKLNKAVSTLNSGKKNFEDKSKLKFLSGDVNVALSQIIKATAPFSKVAFVATEKGYEKYFSRISETIKESGCKYFGLSVTGNKIETAMGIAELFNLPEDVRLIITTDAEVSKKVTYFASITKIPVVIIPTTCSAREYLSPEILIKSGRSIDKVKLNVEKYVLFDKNYLTEIDLLSLYCHIVSKLVAVKDYVVYQAMHGLKPNKTAYTLIKNSVYQTLNVKDFDSNKYELLGSSFLIETINNVTGGQVTSFSSESVASFNLKINSSANLAEAELKCAIKILGLYDVLVNENDTEILYFPDYNERAETLSKSIDIPETAVLKGFLMQAELLLNGRKTAEKIVKRLKGEIKRELLIKKKILSNYYSLGGKDEIENENINKAIKSAGDFPHSINLMSVVRENGITEFL